MTEVFTPGLIFISHASPDKDIIADVIGKIPRSHLFYDTDTINPGRHTTDELDDGLLRASVFAMFVSPNTPKSVWVEYESGVAYVQKVKRNHIAIVAIPIAGATYRDAPDWMHKYLAVPDAYTNSDIARLLKYLYEEVLRNQGIISPSLFVGREDLCNRVIVTTRTKAAETGVPINFVIFGGIPNMGRFSVAKSIIPKIYPGARQDLPVFEIARYGDAVELFLALRQDIVGEGSKPWIEAQIAAFPAEPSEQAKVLMANLAHFGTINQTVVIKSAYGLRNQTRELKPWVAALFSQLKAEPNIRVVWVSDRLLPPETLDRHENVLQFHVSELAEDHVVFLLTELLDVATSSPSVLKRIAPHVHGHPGSAHYVASLIKNSQRAPESLLDRPESIRSFQELCVQQAISEESIGKIGRNIIRLLKLLPVADYDLIGSVFKKYLPREIAQTLWDMTDNCVATYTMSSGYRLADIIRPISLGDDDQLPGEQLEALGKILVSRLRQPNASLASIEALLFVSVRLNGKLPDEFKRVLTGATLQDIVEQHYQLGFKLSADWQDNSRTAARLSLLASEVPMSPDAMETILFWGADSLIRVGDDPTPIIQKMQEKRFPSVSFLLGSFYYHQKRQPELAIPYLEAALKAKSFVKRTGRLLAKVYMEKGQPRAGLNVFKSLGERRVNRDAGLLAQKIRCLRACGEHVEANKLVLAMRTLEDEFGEYDVLTAARLMKEGKYDAALEAVSQAAQRPKVNRINLKLLQTAIQVEKGDFSSLEDTCKLAIAIGLDAGANSLRARAYIKQRKWKDAERELAKIPAKNYYDKLLLLRMFAIKVEDLEVLADPIQNTETQTEHNHLLVELRRDSDGEWDYYH